MDQYTPCANDYVTINDELTVKISEVHVHVIFTILHVHKWISIHPVLMIMSLLMMSSQ